VEKESVGNVKIDIENHERLFPNSAIWVKNGCVYGCWMIGNNYKNKQGYYGEYPPGYLDRVLSLFPSMDPLRTLHLFSGTVPEGTGIRMDINPDLHPDVIGDAEHVKDFFGRGAFDLVIADPPYSKEHAKNYGYKLPVARKVLASLYHVVVPGGHVCWLSTKAPMYARWKRPEWEMAGLVMVYLGTNKDYRGLMILRRQHGKT
jgi:hypothetical protein